MALEFSTQFITSIDPIHVSGAQFKALFDDINAVFAKHATLTENHLNATFYDDAFDCVEQDCADVLPAVQTAIDQGLDAGLDSVEDVVSFIDGVREVVSIPDPMGQEIYATLVSDCGVHPDEALTFARDYINKVAFRKELPVGHSYTEESVLFELATDRLTKRGVNITFNADCSSSQIDNEIDRIEDDYVILIIENEAVAIDITEF